MSAATEVEPEPVATRPEPIHLPAPVESNGGGWLRIIDKMVDKGVPMADLKELFAMQQEWQREQARRAYVAALAGFKANPPTLQKNKTVQYDAKQGGSKVSYSHINLAEACRLLIPALADHGLSHCWITEQKDGSIFVTCRLSHRDGHSESVMLVGSPDASGSKNAIQAVGSTVTYLQRYTFLSLVGMAAEDQDDDGRGGKEPGVTDDQMVMLNGLIDDARDLGVPYDHDRFVKYLGVKSFQELTATSHAKACDFLGRKIAEAKAKAGAK